MSLAQRTSRMQIDKNTMPKSACYMCYFSDDEMCLQFTEFILRESHRSTSRHMAHQIYEELVKEEPDADANGASMKDIDKHIRQHMLHPMVKVPAILRDLDSIRETLQQTLVTRDEESGAKVIDAVNINLYLKVVRELHQMYKLGDVTKLAFGTCAKFDAKAE
jgi:hypothetical protein